MRPSQRDQILNAAIRVVERTGVTGVTFDAVAAEAGITRGGLMYHFRSREALLHDLMILTYPVAERLSEIASYGIAEVVTTG